jgi:hypothetical protein
MPATVRFRAAPGEDQLPEEVSLAEQRAELAPAQAEVSSDCAHHWMIETPNGESSSARCKSCGATRNFLNYSQRKVLTRSVKPANNNTQKMSV